MLSTDGQKAAWKVWITALAADPRLKAWDQEYLTQYATTLDTSTKHSEDMIVRRIMNDFMIIVAKNQA